MKDVSELKEILDRSRRIVFFGGAGVSTASGIPDFRSEDGLYSVNTGKYTLYELEKQDRLRGIVTQNIDGLHKLAGNKRVYELHGSVCENYCVDCETFYPLSRILESDGVPRCDKCGGIIKPWVVLYGEIPDKYTGIGACREISGADTLIVAGTSLAVEPAASYIEYFTGRNLIVINRTPTPADERASLVIRDNIADVFDELFVHVIKNKEKHC